MNLILKLVLAPFSLIYLGITALRNLLFDKGLFKSQKSKHFSIGVGNLSVGGSGKSPFIKYLSQLGVFENPAILSRGYGRKSKGFLEVHEHSSTQEVGDEPKMLSKYARTYVCEKRVIGDQMISNNHDTLLLDDVFQHRNIKPNLNILITEYGNTFTDDYPLPSGRLREWRSGAKRADIVIVSKVRKQDYSHYEQKVQAIRKYNPEAPIFFCRYVNASPINNTMKLLKEGTKVVAFSGLASNVSFRIYCENTFKVQEFYGFKDHHDYTLENLKTIFKNSYDLKIITTAKDYVKIKDICSSEELANIYYTDTSVEFLHDENDFKNIIKSAYQDFHGL